MKVFFADIFLGELVVAREQKTRRVGVNMCIYK